MGYGPFGGCGIDLGWLVDAWRVLFLKLRMVGCGGVPDDAICVGWWNGCLLG